MSSPNGGVSYSCKTFEDLILNCWLLSVLSCTYGLGRLRPSYSFQSPVSAEDRETVLRIAEEAIMKTDGDPEIVLDAATRALGRADFATNLRAYAKQAIFRALRRTGLARANKDPLSNARAGSKTVVALHDVGGSQSENAHDPVCLGFHEILPGLGAFTVCPGGEKQAGANVLEGDWLQIRPGT